jgi:hypothetical protein
MLVQVFDHSGYVHVRVVIHLGNELRLVVVGHPPTSYEHTYV